MIDIDSLVRVCGIPGRPLKGFRGLMRLLKFSAKMCVYTFYQGNDSKVSFHFQSVCDTLFQKSIFKIKSHCLPYTYRKMLSVCAIEF